MCFVYNLILAIPISSYSSFIISLIDSDPAFRPASGSLFYLVWALPLYSLNMVLNSALIVLGKERLVIFSFILGIVSNVTLNLFAIPAYGILGAAGATVLGEMVLLLCLATVYLRESWHSN